MILPLSVNNQSIDSSGITNDYHEAINEYVWNGFEANAHKIYIDYVANELTGIDHIIISDDGDGIEYDDLDETFGAFLTSKKNLQSRKVKTKENKGKGRFSFIAFAGYATWKSIYKSEDRYHCFRINMSADSKNVAEYSEPTAIETNHTGTQVIFSNIFSLTVEDLSYEKMEPALLKEFAWYLYLYKEKNVEIKYHGQTLDYSKYLNTELSESRAKTIEGYSFDISLVVWQESIREKYCCYYFDENGYYKGRSTTTFNRNTVNFNHSVYIKSPFFNNIGSLPTDRGELQTSLMVDENDKNVFNELNKEVKALIEKRMSAYISEKADSFVEQMITDRKTFPEFSKDIYGQMRQNDLKRVTKEIYKIEPLVFYRLKPIQEKSLLGFLNLLLSSEERENILSIIEQIVELSPEQRIEFSNMLKKTALENIIDTIKFIEERFRIIEILRSIVFDLAAFTNEREHIQRIVENHFWLFGEQYTLASADQRMKKALEGYNNILYGENRVEAQLNPDAENERRMDIFLCNNRTVETSFGAYEDENIIVELKAPRVILTKQVYRQIEDYMSYIIRQPCFNSIKRRWKFIAVCTEVDDEIKNRYKAFEDKGKIGLVLKIENYEIYALTWDDIIKSFEIRHKALLDKLKLDRETIAKEIIKETGEIEGREKVNSLLSQA